MKHPMLIAVAGLALAIGLLPAQEIHLAIVPTGVEIDAGNVKVILEPPAIHRVDGKAEKPVFEVVSEREGVAKYPDGAEVTMQVSGSEILCHYQVSEAYKALMFQVTLQMSFTQGLRFAFGSEELKDFPGDFSGQFVDKGDGRKRFSVVDAQGEGFTIDAPANWSAIQDNRAFNWSTFSYQFVCDFRANVGKSSLAIAVEPLKKP